MRRCGCMTHRIPLDGHDKFSHVATSRVHTQYDDRRPNAAGQHSLHILQVVSCTKGE